jgi:hypothetical protein
MGVRRCPKAGLCIVAAVIAGYGIEGVGLHHRQVFMDLM